MTIAVCPGSFDPITYGHIDIIERCASSFDQVVVAVLINNKKSPMFMLEERTEMILKSIVHLPNVRVQVFTGLLVNFMKDINADVIVKGLRAVSDFEYELEMAHTNVMQNPKAQTVFMPTSPQYSYLRSSMVKGLLQTDTSVNISHYVPPHVEEALRNRIK